MTLLSLSLSFSLPLFLLSIFPAFFLFSCCFTYLQQLDLCSWNRYAEDSFVFHDQVLVDKCRSSDPVSCFLHTFLAASLTRWNVSLSSSLCISQTVSEFFKLIGLCHTVLPNEKDGLLHNCHFLFCWCFCPSHKNCLLMLPTKTL